MNLRIDLPGIKERADVYLHARERQGHYNCPVTAAESADDVPVLIAEVARLNAQLEQRARNEARLMNALDEVESMTKDTDGVDIDGGAEIPIGEIRRVLAEAAGRA
jgi:hypothetical protein